ncbi:MAG: DoxX family protein [Gemmatimonadales bacterium]
MTTSTLDVSALGPPRSRALARYVPIVARVLLGLVFFVLGLDGFLHFVPQPSTPLPEAAMAFFGALIKTGYMIPLIKGVEVTVGILLLTNRFVPLALALIAPLVVNIFLFDTVLAPKGAVIGAVVLGLELYLAWSYRKEYRSMLAMRATPG